ncbi:hypothetical protein [Streptomyces sp. NPDC058335]|uniref:hypothetical protein n=1 Tax=Streptomyces sp. NPDC058335 TaxID=3346451 RepID=UPI0036536259
MHLRNRRVASEAVRQVRRGLVRTYGDASRRLSRPLTVEEISQIAAQTRHKNLGVLVNRHIRLLEALKNTCSRATSGSDLLGDWVDFGIDSLRHALAGRGSCIRMTHVRSVRAHLADVGPVGPHS